MRNFLLGCLASTLLTSLAHADTVAFTVSGGGDYLGTNMTYGYTFTLSTTASVTQLGFWDYRGDGLAAAVPVTIWNSAGTPVANATVSSSNGSGETNFYAYANLGAPVILPVGTYTIAGYVTGNDAVQYINGITAAPGVSFSASRSASGNVYPTGDVLGDPRSYYGPNFQFNAVPEPSSWALLAFGAVGAAAMRLRRRRA